MPPPSSGREDVENTAINSIIFVSPTFIHLGFRRVEAEIANIKCGRVRQQATLGLSINLTSTLLPVFVLTSDLLSL